MGAVTLTELKRSVLPAEDGRRVGIACEELERGPIALSESLRRISDEESWGKNPAGMLVCCLEAGAEFE